MSTFAEVVTFRTLNCASCSIQYAITEEKMADLRKTGETFYCPNGHKNFYRDNENDQARRERDRLKQENARLAEAAEFARRDRDVATRQASAARGQVTRLKNAAAAGACPCCDRRYTHLRKHMDKHHPQFVATEEPADANAFTTPH